MKQFFKFFFASMLGFIVGMVVFFFLLIAIMGGIVAAIGSDSEGTAVKANSVLALDLSYGIEEKTNANPFKDISFGNLKPSVRLGLNDILKNIEKAKNDPNIKGIYLDFGYFGAGVASAEQVRLALEDFKKSGKFIVAYAEVYTQKGYYVASVADKVYLNPKGLLEFRGLYTNITFYKGLMDKLGVEAQIFYCGKYKSATEPFRFEKMSDPNKEMTLALLTDIKGHYINAVADARKIPVDELNNISDNLLVQNANDALKYKMVDGLFYTDQVNSFIKEKLSVKDDTAKIKFVGLSKYNKVPDTKKKSLDDAKIAVLYAQGEIVDGKGDDGQIGSATLTKQLVKLRDDDKIKAVVLRVNSPGGSALASDIIWREVARLKEKKPVVVSMGDLAASGGYYISCNASKIVALPTTLTGSIGVFGILPNIKKLMNEKLGITFDGVGTGKYSDLGNVSRPLREDEKIIIQNEVDSIYKNFRYCVSQGRNMPFDSVEAKAQGRVWTGAQGLKLGLVDTLGDLNVAVNIAAKLAKLSKYRTVEYPQDKEDSFTKLFEAIGDQGGDEETMMREQLGTLYPYYKELKSMANMKGIKTRVPYNLEIN